MRQPDHGGSGSPSIWITFSSFTYTFWPQPTAQYGQIDWTTRSAVFVRACSVSVRLERAARPSPSRSSRNWRMSGRLMAPAPLSLARPRQTPAVNLLPASVARVRPARGQQHQPAERDGTSMSWTEPGGKAPIRPRLPHRDRAAGVAAAALAGLSRVRARDFAAAIALGPS